MSVKEELLAVKKENGEMTTTMEETCEVMNRQFQQVFKKSEGIELPPLTPFSGNRLDHCNIDLEEVMTLLQNQKTPSAPGPDGVHHIVIKACAASLAKPLTIIFRQSMESGRLPGD